MTVTLILCALVIAYWIYFKISRWHIEKHGEKIPGDKAYPIIGNVLPFLKVKDSTELINLCDAQGRKYLDFGICRGWAGHQLIVWVFHPKYIEEIARSPNAVEKGPIYSFCLGNYPTGVFTTNDLPKWKVLRKPLTKSLVKKYIENDYHKVFVAKSKQFLQHIKETKVGKETDILPDFRNLSFDIFSETHLGVETNEIKDAKFNFLEHVVRFSEESLAVGALSLISKLLTIIKTVSHKKIEEHKMGATIFLEWALKKRMKIGHIENNGKEMYYTDFLLMRKNNQNMSLRDAARELADVAFAGADTSAVVGSTALLYLAMFPELQEEAYQEQMSIFGDNSMQEPNPNDLASMVFLTRVIKETLRHSSPASVLRHASGDIHLDNYVIPKGTIIMILIQTVSQDKRFWERPMDFYPDHFLPEKEAERPSFAYLPFGCGARICPGNHYGINSVKVMLSFILRNFKVSTTLKYEELNVEHKIMREFKSYNVKFEERIKQS